MADWQDKLAGYNLGRAERDAEVAAHLKAEIAKHEATIASTGRVTPAAGFARAALVDLLGWLEGAP